MGEEAHRQTLFFCFLLRHAGDIWLRMTSVHVGRGGAGDHFEVWVPVEE